MNFLINTCVLCKDMKKIYFGMHFMQSVFLYIFFHSIHLLWTWSTHSRQEESCTWYLNTSLGENFLCSWNVRVYLWRTLPGM